MTGIGGKILGASFKILGAIDPRVWPLEINDTHGVQQGSVPRSSEGERAGRVFNLGTPGQ